MEDAKEIKQDVLFPGTTTNAISGTSGTGIIFTTGAPTSVNISTPPPAAVIAAPPPSAPLPVPVPANQNLPATMTGDNLESIFSFRENFDTGDRIDLPKIKIIKETGTFFDPQLNDSTYKEIFALILPGTTPNALWLPEGHSRKNETVNGTKLPDCSSPDGVKPLHEIYSDTCKSCEFNQFGSVNLIKGENGKGKACKNAVLLPLFILTNDKLKWHDVDYLKELFRGIPYTLTTSATSRKNIIQYKTNTLGLGLKIHFSLVITRLRLRVVREPFTYSVLELDYCDEIASTLRENIEMAKFYKAKCDETQKILMGTQIVEKDELAGNDENETRPPW